MQTSHPKNAASPASASDHYAQLKKRIMKLDHRFDASPEALSKREMEVLSWVIQGKRDGEIGVILEISSRTVEKHVGRILHKLRVENSRFILERGKLNGAGDPNTGLTADSIQELDAQFCILSKDVLSLAIETFNRIVDFARVENANIGWRADHSMKTESTDVRSMN
jgi:DNA-binding CsgD family transcriptional regulator